MDISPDRSTPLSEHSYGAREASAAAARAHEAHAAVPPVVVLDNSHHNVSTVFNCYYCTLLSVVDTVIATIKRSVCVSYLSHKQLPSYVRDLRAA